MLFILLANVGFVMMNVSAAATYQGSDQGKPLQTGNVSYHNGMGMRHEIKLDNCRNYAIYMAISMSSA